MKRREFITFLGGAAAWPNVAHGQQAERVRRVGVLSSANEGDFRKRFALFHDRLGQLRVPKNRGRPKKVTQPFGHELAREIAVACEPDWAAFAAVAGNDH